MLEATCPFCRTSMPFVAELVGREVFCLGCGRHFVFPKAESEAGTADPLSNVELLTIDLVSKPPSADD